MKFTVHLMSDGLIVVQGEDHWMRSFYDAQEAYSYMEENEHA